MTKILIPVAIALSVFFGLQYLTERLPKPEGRVWQVKPCKDSTKLCVVRIK